MKTSTRQPAPRRQGERRAATRQKILRSAGRVFAARGFHGATLDEVGEAAGVSKGAVYYNFESKDDLFVSLLEERLAERLDEVRRSLADGSDAVLQSAGSGFLDRLQRDPRWPPLFFEFVAYAARDPEVRARFGTWVRDTRTALAEVIELRAARGGGGPPLPPDELALAVSSLANGMLIEALFDPDGTPPGAFDRFLGLLLGDVP